MNTSILEENVNSGTISHFMEAGLPHGYLSGTVNEFRAESRSPEYLIDALVDAHRIYNRDEDPSDEQINAWRYAIDPLNELFDLAELNGEQIVVLEAMLKNRSRVDTLLCGNDGCIDNVVLFEFKRWHWKRKATQWSIRYDLQPSQQEGMIDVVFENDGETSIWTKPQPIVQLKGYKRELAQHKKLLIPDRRLDITGCVYLHDCCWLTEAWRALLLDVVSEQLREEIPIYARDDIYPQPEKPKRDLQHLAERLGKRLRENGTAAFEKLKLLLNDVLPPEPASDDVGVTEQPMALPHEIEEEATVREPEVLTQVPIIQTAPPPVIILQVPEEVPVPPIKRDSPKPDPALVRLLKWLRII